MVAPMSGPVVPVACYRCGGPCLECICAPCPRCEPMICSDCPLDLEQIRAKHGSTINVPRPGDSDLVVHRGRDARLPPHSAPVGSRKKEPDPIEVVKDEHDYTFRPFNSTEILPFPAPEIVKAICWTFGSVAAGLVVASVVLGFTIAFVAGGRSFE